MSVALPAGADGEGASVEIKLAATVGLLTKAIDLLDSAGVPADLAARVQEGLDAIAKYRSSLGS